MVTRSSIEASIIDGALWVKMEDCVMAIQHARRQESIACYNMLMALDAETESHTHYLRAAKRLKELRGLDVD